MTDADTVLIVDDEPLTLELLERQLGKLGYVTVCAENGLQALGRAEAVRPDLILLDVMMPELDGIETCRRLKQDAGTRLIPIIIMTALNAVQDRINAFEAGANDYVTKPVDRAELQARIEASLRQKRAFEATLSASGQIINHYAKFVPEVVRRMVLDNPDAPELGKRDQEASIVFVDICGYSRLMQTTPHEQLNVLIEKYFSAFLDRLHQHDGDISETSGDGLMAIFHGQQPAEQARSAVAAAVAIMHDTLRLNAQLDGPCISLHVGINSGTASVGSTRFEGVNRARWVYTADGHTANIAARLCALASTDEVFVGPETARLAGSAHPLRALGPRPLKNIAEPVAIHRVEWRDVSP